MRRPACRPADWQVNSGPESRRACADSANASHPAWCISQCRRICPPRVHHPQGPMPAGRFLSIPARPLDILAENECLPDNRRCNPPFPSLSNFQIFIVIIIDHCAQCLMRILLQDQFSYKLLQISIYKLLINSLQLNKEKCYSRSNSGSSY